MAREPALHQWSAVPRKEPRWTAPANRPTTAAADIERELSRSRCTFATPPGLAPVGGCWPAVGCAAGLATLSRQVMKACLVHSRRIGHPRRAAAPAEFE